MVARIFAGRFSRAERVRQRRHINLEDASLTDATRSRYYAALRKLLPAVEGCDLLHELDDKLCLWIRRMWEEGEPSLTIGDGLSALHHFQPWTKRRIPHSWKLFSIWRKVEVPCRAPPLTWELVCALAGYELHRNHLEMSCLLLVSFHCLLRTGEALKLRLSDVILGASAGICRLQDTKSGRRNAANEAISITDGTVLECLRTLMEVRRCQQLEHAPLWNQTAASFRKRFKHLMVKFGLEGHAFRPYSLRRGGATQLFQLSGSMELALLRGRWESSRVAKIYIADALSHLPRIRMSAHTAKMIDTYTLLR